jgi:hypothetical protein
MDAAALKHLSQRSAERAADGSPETLQDIIVRARYAAEWNLDQAEVKARQAREFGRMSKHDGYTLQQRADAEYAAAHCFGEATVRRDAATTLDSIADALVTLVGK